MIYLELEKKQQEESRKRFRGYSEIVETMKEKKDKEAEADVKTQNICRRRNQGD